MDEDDRPAKTVKEYTRERALEFRCPQRGCWAEPGELCRNLTTGQPLVGPAAHYLRVARSQHAVALAV